MGKSLARPALGLAVVCLGTVGAALDSAVNIALPSISGAFGIEIQDIRWIVIAYVLTYSSLLLIFGKLGDLFGYRLIFRLGLIVSAPASPPARSRRSTVCCSPAACCKASALP